MYEQLPTASQPSVERTYLQKSTLAQAIARVNRPYPDKESGLVVDYFGVFEDLQRALAFDIATISKGLINLEKLKERFANLLLAAQAAVAPINLSDDSGRLARAGPGDAAQVGLLFVPGNPEAGWVLKHLASGPTPIL